MCVERVERLSRPGWIAGAGQDGPTLRKRVDLTFGAGGRAHRLTAVEVRPTIPLAVPGVSLDVLPEFRGLPQAQVGEWFVLAPPGDGFESYEHVIEEECQPHAFPLAVLADQIHSIVPISGSHEREPVIAESQT